MKFCFSYFRRVSNLFVKNTHTHKSCAERIKLNTSLEFLHNFSNLRNNNKILGLSASSRQG